MNPFASASQSLGDAIKQTAADGTEGGADMADVANPIRPPEQDVEPRHSRLFQLTSEMLEDFQKQQEIEDDDEAGPPDGGPQDIPPSAFDDILGNLPILQDLIAARQNAKQDRAQRERVDRVAQQGKEKSKENLNAQKQAAEKAATARAAERKRASGGPRTSPAGGAGGAAAGAGPDPGAAPRRHKARFSNQSKSVRRTDDSHYKDRSGNVKLRMKSLSNVEKIEFLKTILDPGTLMALNPFVRLVHYITYHVLYDFSTHRKIVRFPKSAIVHLMSAMADMICLMFTKAYIVTEHCGRVTLNEKDIRTALQCQNKSLANFGEMIPKEWRGYLATGFRPSFGDSVNRPPTSRPMEARNFLPAGASRSHTNALSRAVHGSRKQKQPKQRKSG